MTPPGVQANATVEPREVRLADPVTVTLTVEGPVPVRVTAPADLLAEPSAAAWCVTPAGPATTSPLPNGRERWTLTLSADPQVPGPAVPLAFAPAGVRSGPAGDPGTVDWPVLSVAVTTSLTGDIGRELRGVTGIGAPPQAPAPAAVPWAAVVAGGALVVAIVGVAVRLRRWPSPSPAPSPTAGLAALAADSLPDVAFAERLAELVRAWAGPPAARQTTAELLATLAADPRREVVRDVLETCDRAKFAAAPLPPAARSALIASAAALFAGRP